jgi:hypothetical protein
MQRYTDARLSKRALLLYFSGLIITVTVVNKRMSGIVKPRLPSKQKAQLFDYFSSLKI